MEFSPELQRRWWLSKLSMPRSDRVTILLQSSVQVERAAPLGRHGRDILSFPAIYRNECEGTFEFTDCVVVHYAGERKAINYSDLSPTVT